MEVIIWIAMQITLLTVLTVISAEIAVITGGIDMKIIGIIKSGELVGEKIQYNCIKCLTPVELEFTPFMSEKTVECFKNMAHAQLCLDCHVDKKVPEIVECLLH